MMKSYGGRVTSTVTTRPLHGSGQRTGLTSFPVTLVSGWGKKQSAHQTGCSLTVCTPLQDLCLFLLSLLMFLHKHTQLDQSIPPMSCCLYDGVTRLPVAWPPSALPFSPPPPIPPPPIPPTPPRPELPRASGTTGKEGRSPL